jgi:hypothetical protein
MYRTAWIGFDPREIPAFAVAKDSLQRNLKGGHVQVFGLVLDELRARGIYYRPTERRDGKLWDVISEAPMSTEFAISRFLVPHIARPIHGRYGGWALFTDSDVLWRANAVDLFKKFDNDKAVMCVKHNYNPPEGVKMDGQEQLRYARKNWSSVMAFNLDHPSNEKLTVELVNTVPGRDLHRFCWLEDDEIGELTPDYNFLVGHTDPSIDPKLVHHTEGSPCMVGYEDTAYADEWRKSLNIWAQGALSLPA